MNFPPAMSGAGKTLATALWGPALIFRGLSQLRRRAYDTGLLETVRVPVPVVCVGNLTVGGSGKTPVVAWLARRWSLQNRRVIVLSRGHGRKANGVRVVPNDGEAPFPSAREIGDEPRLLAQLLPGVPVVVGADRAASAEKVLARSPDLFLMDDGFQHHRLFRDVNVVCLDARLAHAVWVLGAPTPRLPAGPWREGPEALSRASVLVLTRAQRLDAGERVALRAALSFFHGPIGMASDQLKIYEHATGRPLPLETLRGKPLLAVSGLGDPGAFEDGLARCGGDVRGERFSDHHFFTTDELRRVFTRAASQGRTVIVTEKDAQRLPSDAPVWVAGLDLVWEDDRWVLWIESVLASNTSR